MIMVQTFELVNVVRHEIFQNEVRVSTFQNT